MPKAAKFNLQDSVINRSRKTSSSRQNKLINSITASSDTCYPHTAAEAAPTRDQEDSRTSDLRHHHCQCVKTTPPTPASLINHQVWIYSLITRLSFSSLISMVFHIDQPLHLDCITRSNTFGNQLSIISVNY